MENTVSQALFALITYFALISMAAERCTEIVKRLFLLGTKIPDKYQVVFYQVLSCVFGALCVYLTPPTGVAALQQIPIHLLAVLGGLACSGGAAFWHDALGYINAAKTITQQKQ